VLILGLATTHALRKKKAERCGSSGLNVVVVGAVVRVRMSTANKYEVPVTLTHDRSVTSSKLTRTSVAGNTVDTVFTFRDIDQQCDARPTCARFPPSHLRRSSLGACVMNCDPEQLRRELAHLVNDQADAAERTLTDAERRGFEERQEQINALCDELHGIAAQTQ
jgi:hypothetical protein